MSHPMDFNPNLLSPIDSKHHHRTGSSSFQFSNLPASTFYSRQHSSSIDISPICKPSPDRTPSRSPLQSPMPGSPASLKRSQSAMCTPRASTPQLSTYLPSIEAIHSQMKNPPNFTLNQVRCILDQSVEDGIISQAQADRIDTNMMKSDFLK